jgi:hypothetical protein
MILIIVKSAKKCLLGVYLRLITLKRGIMNDKMLKCAVIFSFLLCFFQTNAQESRSRPLSISVFTMATQFPGGKIIPFHPGLELGTEFRYNQSDKNQWLQTIKCGGYYHKYSQTALQLYSEVNYRRKIFQKLSGDAKLGAGYLLAFPNLQTFELKDGKYEKKKFSGRSQFMISVALGLRYLLSESKNGPQLFMNMQVFLQAPFIKSYVPVLPNTVYHVGVAFPFFKTKNKKTS